MIKKRKIPCEAVMLLMERMGSHPEEFNLSGGKWGELFNVVKQRAVDGNKDKLVVLDDFEVEMLWSKFCDAGRDQLHSYVMQRILNPKGEKSE